MSAAHAWSLARQKRRKETQSPVTWQDEEARVTRCGVFPSSGGWMGRPSATPRLKVNVKYH